MENNNSENIKFLALEDYFLQIRSKVFFLLWILPLISREKGGISKSFLFRKNPLEK